MIRFYTYIFILTYSIQAFANNAINLGGNYSLYNSEKLSDYKISPKGSGYHFIFSQNYDRIGLEFSYSKDNLNEDVRFDQINSKLRLNITALGLGFYLALNKDVLFRAGMAWYKTKGTLDDFASDLQKYAMKEAWGIKDSQKDTGYYLGAQYKLISSRSIDLYTNYRYQKISDKISTHSFGLGITFKFDLQL